MDTVLITHCIQMGIYLKDSAGNEVLAVSVYFVLTYHPPPLTFLTIL
jgi:hypothetical protein